MVTAADDARAFLEIAGQYRLGELDTEQPHPLTTHLSSLARDDLAAGFQTLKEVDRLALLALADASSGICSLARAVDETLHAGGRIYMAGCGATGRLALTLEVLCREGLLPGDRVVGFMAGGDAALIRSLEGFEDYPDYGARQLRELGFRSGDLMIGVTEGGETPFVIGATEAARDTGGRAPWFCYCNPDAVLARVAERSRRVLEDPHISKLNLSCGPMALAGSTRMQATTVQMAAIGFALMHHGVPEEIPAALTRLQQAQGDAAYAALAPLTEAEAACASLGEGVLYESNCFGMTVLTDTTERSPTFSLPAFENIQAPEQPACLCYLMTEAPDAASAWRTLLRREPRTLEWPDVVHVAGRSYMMGYDISQQAEAHRHQKLGQESRRFTIGAEKGMLVFRLQDRQVCVPAPEDALARNLILKMLLNAHSTLLMGRLGRFEGNMMTWVRPGNNKLIDRAIRYIRSLAVLRGGSEPDYACVCQALFAVKQDLGPDEAIVLKTLAHMGLDRVA